jgi:hypothetical protein
LGGGSREPVVYRDRSRGRDSTMKEMLP